MTVPQDQSDQLARSLLEWYRANRRDLPWRGGSAYAVWISEIMLQQTQVATVIPFFLRFMERFPTIEALAGAPVDDVLQQWAGLGYYARARNLHRAARLVVGSHGSRLPDTLEAIERLPGIGRYTAGAILSIAYSVRIPLVDANVARVLSRLFGLRGDPKSTRNQAALWGLAEQLVPAEAPGDFNQGLMELGALICRPDDPLCERCPLLLNCFAGNSPDPTELPEIPPGRATVAVSHSSAFIMRQPESSGRFDTHSLLINPIPEPGTPQYLTSNTQYPIPNTQHEVLIVQRPMHGLWGGLWEFPRVVCERGETAEEAAIRAAREIVGLDVAAVARLGLVKHSVTHHRISLYGIVARQVVADQGARPLQCAAVRWAPVEDLERYAFAAPQAILRDMLGRHLSNAAGHGNPLAILDPGGITQPPDSGLFQLPNSIGESEGDPIEGGSSK